MSQVKALLFDIGGVLLRLNWNMVRDRLGSSYDVDGQSLPQFVGGWDQYDAYERNAISCETFFTQLGTRISYRGDLQAAWNSLIGEPFESVEAFLKSLPPSLRLAALSNTNKSHLTHIRERFDFFGSFERVIGSYEIGHRKPQPEAFFAVLDMLDLNAEEVLFLDDSLKNVEAAAGLGFQTVHILDPNRQLPQLRL